MRVRLLRAEEHQINRNHVQFPARLGRKHQLQDGGVRSCHLILRDKNRMHASSPPMCFIISQNQAEDKRLHTLRNDSGQALWTAEATCFRFCLTYFLSDFLLVVLSLRIATHLGVE